MFTSRVSWCSERCSTHEVLSDCMVCPSLLLSRNKELTADIIPMEKVSMLHQHGYGFFLPGTASYCHSYYSFFWCNGKHFSVFTIILKVFSCGKVGLSMKKFFWDSSQGFPSCPKCAAISPILEMCCLYREAVQTQLASCLCSGRLMVWNTRSKKRTP